MIIKLTGNTSILNHHFKLGIANTDFHLALRSFVSTNFIPNVTEKNNKFYFKGVEHTIPTGQYDLKALKNYFKKNHELTLKEDDVGNKLLFEGIHQIDVQKENNICQLLGYPYSYPKINPVDSINVHCNLVSGQVVSEGYCYEQETDIISTFKMNTFFKQAIIYECSNPIYFPVHHNRINSIEIKITDENGDLINFGGAPITILLEIQ